MDDARIRQLTEEVLAQIGGAGRGLPPRDLESRVATLEANVERSFHDGRVETFTFSTMYRLQHYIWLDRVLGNDSW